MEYPTFNEWFDSLSEANQQNTRRISALLEEMGAQDPNSWARSEVSENLAQTARYIVLSRIRRETIDKWSTPGEIDRDSQYSDEYKSIVSQLKSLGASEDLLVQFAKNIAYSTAFSICYIIDEGVDPWGPEEAPGWSPVEINSEGELTGRDVGSIHESLSEVSNN